MKPPDAPPPPSSSSLPAEVRQLARGGAINLVGAIGGAVFTFAAFLVAARLHSTAQVGAFTVAVAVFTILRQVAMAGAQVGWTRFLPRDAAPHPERLRTSLRVGLEPLLVVSVLAGVVAWYLGDDLAALLGNDADAALVSGHLRWMAVALPPTAVFVALTFATRGLGTMTPAAVVDSIGRSGLQLAGIAATAWIGAQWLGLAWALPYVVGLPVLAVWLGRLLRGAGARPGLVDPMPLDEARSRFWRFAGPRGVASTVQVAVLWTDTILLGALAGAAEAGIYSIATRFLVVGSLATGAVLQVSGPRFSQLLGEDDTEGLQATYRTAARWVIWLVWPAYLVLGIFPEPLLRIFGEQYVVAGPTVTVLAFATCIAAAAGAVDMVLLMSGRSMLSLGNWTMALVVDVALALVLIPRYGIFGAAIAWAVAIVVVNIVPLLQVRALLRVDPFGTGYWRALATPLVIFGVGGGVLRLVTGPTLTALVALVLVGGALYAVLLVRWRHHLYVTAPPS